MSISKKSFADKCFAGKFVATSRKGGASSISSAGLGLHMAELQPSKTKSLRVAKHGPRKTSCLVNAIHHKPSRKAITLYVYFTAISLQTQICAISLMAAPDVFLSL